MKRDHSTEVLGRRRSRLDSDRFSSSVLTGPGILLRSTSSQFKVSMKPLLGSSKESKPVQRGKSQSRKLNAGLLVKVRHLLI